MTIVASEEEQERASQYLTRVHVDGVLLVSEHRDDPLPERLAESGVPYVHGGPRWAWHGSMSATSTSAAGTWRHGTCWRVADTAIATISGPQDIMAGVERLRCYGVALREAGQQSTPARIAAGDFSCEGARGPCTNCCARSPTWTRFSSPRT